MSLASLSQRIANEASGQFVRLGGLFAQVDEGDGAPAQVDEGDGAPPAIPTDPVEEDEEKAPPSFQSADPLEFYLARQWLQDEVFGGSLSGFTAAANAFLNAQANRLGTTAARDIIADQVFRSAAQAFLLRVSGVPEEFILQDEENPNAGFTVVTLDDVNGIQEQQVSAEVFGTNTPGTFEIGESEVANENPDLLNRLDPQTQAALSGGVTRTNAAGVQVRIGAPSGLPTLTNTEIQNIVSSRTTTSRGGGGSRTKLAFDREALIEEATDLYRGWLFELPDDRSVEGWVDDYINRAQSFYLNQGGRLEYGTFIRDKVRDTPRYSYIFRHKPGEMEEEDFLSDFMGPINSLGLRADEQNRQTVAALTSGGSAAGQFKRVSRTREAVNQGGFSRQLAATVQSMGRAGRA